MDDAGAAQTFLPAARAALEAFRIAPARLDFVNVSENVTFRVTDEADRDFVLRLHRPWYHTLERLKGERVWTRALAAAGVAVPEGVITHAGDDYVRVAVEPLGEQRWAGLARWIEGRVLFGVVEAEADAVANEGHFERLGGIMAALHNQAARWSPPGSFERHALDADGLMGEAPFWGPFWDHPMFSPAERALMLATRDRIHAALSRYGRDPATFSLIHADLHPGNVLIDGDHLAVIDFDDAAFGWHLYDLAVALVFYQDHAHFAGFRDACLRGYGAVRPLPDDVVRLLPMFLLIRRLVQIGWLHARPELPEWSGMQARKVSLLARAGAFEPPC
ncbi:MAG: aminoglycoside phosphotransferase [Caulobacteraceae bacterium]|nr:aminoglycoside phosphotransferase [Caulobacteraceae bacterium]